MKIKIKAPFIEETRFGNWFLKTATWRYSVLSRALNDLLPLIPSVPQKITAILDIGCGFGHSFQELAHRFSPELIVGVDADPAILERASTSAAQCSSQVQLLGENAAHMSIPDSHFDLIFCHQSFHHIVEQELAMTEFFRVLKPGGILLFAESTKRYIHSLPIRILFRHPMDVQKTAEEYVEIIRDAGFDLPDKQISLPFLWWSRRDIGFFEWIGFSVPKEREETMVNAVAIKPL